MQVNTKLGMVKVRVIEAATAAALQTAVNDFLAGAGTPVIVNEKLVAPIQYMAYDSSHYSALIQYSE